jgi:2',3'-cyclic-nucleotide 2'-phosphodiesterase (5'-nucleotidase family)
VITMGGDVNFATADRRDPLPNGFEAMTADLKGLLDGDLNFANIETVVTDRHDLHAEDKRFCFRTHPNALRYLLSMGFNFFSLANNHAYDYGAAGVEETLSNLELFQSQALKPFSYMGIGRTRAEVVQPAVFQVQGITIAFAAISFAAGNAEARANKSGQLNFADDRDYNELLFAIKNTVADYKILSTHWGTEMQVQLDSGQRGRFERAINEAGVNLIIGAHPHVVRPIEMKDGNLIMYSLGNYAMVGASDISVRPLGTDYGLFTRLYLERDAQTQRVRVQALEALPLTAMNSHPHVLPPLSARAHIEYLNQLSRSQLGAQAVQFEVRSDGTGLACDRTAELSPRAKAVCEQIPAIGVRSL